MDLKIISIHNHGSIDKERVWMKVIRDCNLNNYAVSDTTYDEEGYVSNKLKHFFWFPSLSVEAGDYVSLRTGVGKHKTLVNDDGNTVHRFYWGLRVPVWNNDGDVAALFHLGEWVFKNVK